MSIVFAPKIPLALQPVKPVLRPNRVPKHSRTPLSNAEKDEFVRLRALNVSYPTISERMGRSPTLWHRVAAQPDLFNRIKTARNALINGVQDDT